MLFTCDCVKIIETKNGCTHTRFDSRFSPSFHQQSNDMCHEFNQCILHTLLWEQRFGLGLRQHCLYRLVAINAGHNYLDFRISFMPYKFLWERLLLSVVFWPEFILWRKLNLKTILPLHILFPYQNKLPSAILNWQFLHLNQLTN